MVSKLSLQFPVASGDLTLVECISTQHSYEQINMCWLKEKKINKQKIFDVKMMDKAQMECDYSR